MEGLLTSSCSQSNVDNRSSAQARSERLSNFLQSLPQSFMIKSSAVLEGRWPNGVCCSRAQKLQMSQKHKTGMVLEFGGQSHRDEGSGRLCRMVKRDERGRNKMI